MFEHTIPKLSSQRVQTNRKCGPGWAGGFQWSLRIWPMHYDEWPLSVVCTAASADTQAGAEAQPRRSQSALGNTALAFLWSYGHLFCMVAEPWC